MQNGAWRQWVKPIGVSGAALSLLFSVTYSHSSAAQHDQRQTGARGEYVELALTEGPDVAHVGLILQSLLGDHALLALDMMRARVGVDEDLAQATNAALGRNTSDLQAAVTAVYGSAVAGEFATAWSAHVTALFNYARGVGNKDANAQAQAKSQLTQYEQAIGQVLNRVTRGRLSSSMLADAIRMHVNDLIAATDSFASGDFGGAYRTQRMAYAHMFEFGAVLAGGIAASFGRSSASLASPGWRLQSKLGMLLGEHVALTTESMRAAGGSAPSFQAVSDSMNANTIDLTQGIQVLLGRSAATRFAVLWAAHIDALISYAVGVGSHDSNRQTQALGRLSQFQAGLSHLLATATGSRLPAAALQDAFAMHDGMLREQETAYVASDFEKAHDVSFTAYKQMFAFAAQLAAAVASAQAANAPRGGAATGGGGMAAVVERR
jgi:hypothetical protein